MFGTEQVTFGTMAQFEDSTPCLKTRGGAAMAVVSSPLPDLSTILGLTRNPGKLTMGAEKFVRETRLRACAPSHGLLWFGLGLEA